MASTVAGPQTELVWWRRPPDIAVDDVPWSFVEATVGMMTPFSLTGSPVVVLPAAIEDGLPVGFQFVGRRWQDEVLLATCAAIELVLGGRRLPPRLLDGA